MNSRLPVPTIGTKWLDLQHLRPSHFSGYPFRTSPLTENDRSVTPPSKKNHRSILLVGWGVPSIQTVRSANSATRILDNLPVPRINVAVAPGNKMLGLSSTPAQLIVRAFSHFCQNPAVQSPCRPIGWVGSGCSLVLVVQVSLRTYGWTHNSDGATSRGLTVAASRFFTAPLGVTVHDARQERDVDVEC